MSLIDMIIFALTLHATVGYDHRPGEVPLGYGAMVYEASMHHEMDPFLAGGVLLAENKGRSYDPTQRGLYNGKGELLDPEDKRPREAGLFQLMPIWGRELTRRCANTQVIDRLESRRWRYLERRYLKIWAHLTPKELKEGLSEYKASRRYRETRYKKRLRHLYTDGLPPSEGGEPLPDCLWFPKDHYVSSKLGKRKTVSLLTPKINVEAAIVTFHRLQLQMKEQPNRSWDWRARFRCHGDYQYSNNCYYSVRRVGRWEQDIRRSYPLYKAQVMESVRSVEVALSAIAGAPVSLEPILGVPTLDSHPEREVLKGMKKQRKRAIRRILRRRAARRVVRSSNP